jgi:hypothetical protein
MFLLYLAAEQKQADCSEPNGMASLVLVTNAT